MKFSKRCSNYRLRTSAFRLLSFILLMAFLAACGSVDVPQEEVPSGEVTEEAAMRWGNTVEAETSLTAVLTAAEQEIEAQAEGGLEPQFTTTTGVLMDDAKDYAFYIGAVYGSSFTSGERLQFRNNIRAAIRAWLAPLRSMPGGSAITDRIYIYDDTSGASGTRDLTVYFPNVDGRAFYRSSEKKIVLYADDNESYLTYLHEFGHAFGLGDNYIEGVWSCKDGQYVKSVMCNQWSAPDLTADDIRGIQYRYCGAFSSCSSAYYEDMYGGDGGSYATSECSGNQIVGGIRVRSGSLIDGLQIRCRTFSSSGSYTSYSSGTMLGGSGGSYGYHYCAAGQYIRGVKLRTGSKVDSMKIYCTNGSSGAWSGQFGGSGGGTHYYWCPSQYPVVKGVRVRDGSLIDKAGLTCSTKDGKYSVPL